MYKRQGPYGLVALVLWVVGLVAAVPYWWQLYQRDARALREARPKTLPASTVSGVESWWQQTVVPNHVAFAGTRLAKPDPVPGGFTAVVVGEPGRTELEKMQKAIGTVASGRRVPKDQVELGPAPGGDYSGARVTVIERGDNLRKTRYLEDDEAAIDVETGIARVGYFFDLKPAHWGFWTTSAGAQMGINAGSTGAGKSGFGATKLALVHRCELTVSVLLDAQDGSSQPEWNGRTAISREGVEACWEELQALDYVMGRRAHHVAHVPWVDDLGRERHGKPFLLPGDPDVGLTLMYVMVEELPMLLGDAEIGGPATELLAHAAKTWRKPGGAIDVFAQNLGLENFGGKTVSNTLRSNLVGGGSVAAFRTGSSQDWHMVGLAADPSTLPEFWEGTREKTHGLGFMKGIDNRPGGKWRPSISKDLYAVATSPAAGRIDDITAGFFEEYWVMRRRGVDPREEGAVTPAAPVATPKWSSADVEAVVEHALISGPKEMGAICVAARRRFGDMPLGEVPAALRALEKSGRVRRSGESYQLVKEVEQ